MYGSIQDIQQAVDNNGDLTLSMRALLDAIGAERSTSGNRVKISAELANHGLKHWPVDLPDRQSLMVKVFYDPNRPNISAYRVSQPYTTDIKLRRNLLSKEERFGELWNDFGPPPDELEYALAQLSNARGSRQYSIVHGRLHPHSNIAKESYEKTVERCFVCEKRVFEVHQTTRLRLPVNFRFEYFNSKEVPQELVGETPEGLSIIKGYKFKGVGKARECAGVTLPIIIDPKSKRR